MATNTAIAARQGSSAGLARSKPLAPSRRGALRDRVVVEAMVGRVLYWVAVVAISLAFVVGLIIFFESRDDSSLEGAGSSTPSGLVT